VLLITGCESQCDGWAPGLQTVGPAYGQGAKIFTTANAQIYGRWIGARYRDKGIVWILGGDSKPYMVARGSLTRAYCGLQAVVRCVLPRESR